MALNNIELVIFDNDGVLIDSEIIWHHFFVKHMSSLGFSISEAESISIFTGVNHGKPLDEILNHEFGDSYTKIDFEKVANNTERSYPELLKPISNIDKVIDFISKNGIKKCVASNGDFEYIRRSLEIVGFDKYFDTNCLFGINDNISRKPAPDVFLHAAKTFNIEPGTYEITDQLVINKEHVCIIGSYCSNYNR